MSSIQKRTKILDFARTHKITPKELLQIMFDNNIEPMVMLNADTTACIANIGFDQNKTVQAPLMPHPKSQVIPNARGFYLSKEQCQKITQDKQINAPYAHAILVADRERQTTKKITAQEYGKKLNKKNKGSIVRWIPFLYPLFYFVKKIDLIDASDYVALRNNLTEVSLTINDLAINFNDELNLKSKLDEHTPESLSRYLRGPIPKLVPIESNGSHISSKLGQLIIAYNKFREIISQFNEEKKSTYEYNDARKDFIELIESLNDSTLSKKSTLSKELCQAAAIFIFKDNKSSQSPSLVEEHLRHGPSKLIRLLDLMKTNYELIRNNFTRQADYIKLLENSGISAPGKQSKKLSTIISITNYKQGGFRSSSKLQTLDTKK